MSVVIRKDMQAKHRVARDYAERPMIIYWEMTQACGLACRHCRAEAQPDHDPLALSTEEAKRLLDQVESFGRPRPIFIFTGGDPFKRTDIFELVRYAAEILVRGVDEKGAINEKPEVLEQARDLGRRLAQGEVMGPIQMEPLAV